MTVNVNFTISDELAQRLASAYGKELGLMDEDLTDPENPVYTPRDATMSEFRAKLGNMAMQVVYNQERKDKIAAITVEAATMG